MLTTLIAIALVGISVALALYLAGLVWNAAWPPVGALLERQRFLRYVARSRSGDRCLQDGEFSSALAEFEAAFYPYPARTAGLTQAINNHHTGLLSRLIATADHLQDHRVRLMSLAKVDRLFHERAALQRRYLTLCRSGSSARLRELDRQFRANTRELRTSLASLAAEIATARETPRYH